MNTRMFRIALWFLLAALGAHSAEYREVGGSVVLTPQPVSGEITSIIWKCNGDIVTEWIKDQVDLVYYGRFKGHAALDTPTGVLTLSNANTALSGEYKVEINFKVQNLGYQVHILNRLQEPKVSVQPLVCGHESERCALVCESDVTDVGSVTYSWWKDGQVQVQDQDQVTEMSEKRLNITNDEKTRGVKSYSCKIKNPIKELESGQYSNPFYKPPPFPIVYILIVIVILIILVAALVVAWIKRDKLRSMWNTRDHSAPPPTQNGAGPNESQPLNEAVKDS